MVIVNIFEDDQMALNRAKEFQDAELDGDYFSIEIYDLIKKSRC